MLSSFTFAMRCCCTSGMVSSSTSTIFGLLLIEFSGCLVSGVDVVVAGAGVSPGCSPVNDLHVRVVPLDRVADVPDELLEWTRRPTVRDHLQNVGRVECGDRVVVDHRLLGRGDHLSEHLAVPDLLLLREDGTMTGPGNVDRVVDTVVLRDGEVSADHGLRCGV